MTDLDGRAALPLARAHELVCARSELTAHATLEAERAHLETFAGRALDYGMGLSDSNGVDRLRTLRTVLPARVQTMRQRLLECAGRGMVEMLGRPTDTAPHQVLDAAVVAEGRFDFEAESVRLDSAATEWHDVIVRPPGTAARMSEAA